jgi:hypothetical protein
MRRFFAAASLSATAVTVTVIVFLAAITALSSGTQLTVLQATFNIGAAEICMLGLPVAFGIVGIVGGAAVVLTKHVPIADRPSVKIPSAALIGAAVLTALWVALFGPTAQVWPIGAGGALAGAIGGLVFWYVYER